MRFKRCTSQPGVKCPQDITFAFVGDRQRVQDSKGQERALRRDYAALLPRVDFQEIIKVHAKRARAHDTQNENKDTYQNFYGS
jgi:hypothetical protein